MKRLIKFRGKIASGWNKGKYVYGDLCTNSLQGEVCIRTFWGNVPVKREVVPESVAQFVAEDKELNSVYEGDILVDELENEHIAEIYDRPNFIAGLKLKEKSNDKKERDGSCEESGFEM